MAWLWDPQISSRFGHRSSLGWSRTHVRVMVSLSLGAPPGDLGLLGGYGLPLLATGDAVALVAAASILRRGRPSPALEKARK